MNALHPNACPGQEISVMEMNLGTLQSVNESLQRHLLASPPAVTDDDIERFNANIRFRRISRNTLQHRNVVSRVGEAGNRRVISRNRRLSGPVLYCEMLLGRHVRVDVADDDPQRGGPGSVVIVPNVILVSDRAAVAEVEGMDEVRIGYLDLTTEDQLGRFLIRQAGRDHVYFERLENLDLLGAMHEQTVDYMI